MINVCVWSPETLKDDYSIAVSVSTATAKKNYGRRFQILARRYSRMQPLRLPIIGWSWCSYAMHELCRHAAKSVAYSRVQ